MISLDNLRTVLNAIKRTLDSTKQDKLIAGENITIADDGKTIASAGKANALGYFRATYTKQSAEDFTLDKTFAQVKEEIANNNLIMLVDNFSDIDGMFILTYNSSGTVAFTAMIDDARGWLTFAVTSDDKWQVDVQSRVAFDMYDALSNEVGNLLNLTTTDKTSLVAAVNEVKHTADSKQDKLTAGDNITIAADGKTISANTVGILEVTLTTQNGVSVADKTFEQVKTAVENGIPVLKVHSDGDLLWFFLLDKSPTEIDFIGLVDEQIIAYLTAKQDDTWETTVAARVTAEMLSAVSEKIGSLGQLTTTDKTNIVAAVNEVKHTADNKQDKLIAGANITISADGKTISAAGGGGTTVELDTTLSTAGKAADAKATGDALAGKVDKVTGKELSSNDYTDAAKAKVDAIPADPKYTDTVYDDTGVRDSLSFLATMTELNNDRIEAIESELDGNVPGTTLYSLTTKGEVEIYGSQPHLDFHYNNSTEDYTSRIIETASGRLNLSASNGVQINGKKTENEAVTLTVNANRITNLAYTAKYNELLGAVFVRIYGKINASMSVGYGYTIFNIGSHLPNAVAALSVKIGSDASSSITKKAAAYAQSTGAINLQPLDEGLNGYDIYITGFWFT